MTRLKAEDEDFIPVSSAMPAQQLATQSEDGEQQPKSKFEYKSWALSLEDMVDLENLKHIQMTEVPDAYFTTMKQMTGKKIQYYDNLLQITIHNHGMIFDLDSLEEVDAIE